MDPEYMPVLQAELTRISIFKCHIMFSILGSLTYHRQHGFMVRARVCVKTVHFLESEGERYRNTPLESDGVRIYAQLRGITGWDGFQTVFHQSLLSIIEE